MILALVLVKDTNYDTKTRDIDDKYNTTSQFLYEIFNERLEKRKQISQLKLQ